MKRVIILFALACLFLLSYLIAQQAPARSQLSVGVAFFITGLVVLFFIFGGGVQRVAKETVVIRKGISGETAAFHGGTYFFMPLIHSIEAVMPDYLLLYEFPVDSIDTRTSWLHQIKQIKVRIAYRVSDAEECFDASANLLDQIKQLEEHEKLERSDPRLWKRVLNHLMRDIIDDAIRDGVWNWAEAVAQDANLCLTIPFNLPSPIVENDPYSLSLNRNKLAEKVVEEVKYKASGWGIKIEGLAFENIEIDKVLIERKNRNKDRELAEATHVAQKEAIAIRLKGEAEAQVRADTIAKVIDVLIQQKAITLTDQVIYNIVRAAMYTDGEMIWKGVVEKSANGNVKTA